MVLRYNNASLNQKYLDGTARTAFVNVSLVDVNTLKTTFTIGIPVDVEKALRPWLKTWAKSKKAVKYSVFDDTVAYEWVETRDINILKQYDEDLYDCYHSLQKHVEKESDLVLEMYKQFLDTDAYVRSMFDKHHNQELSR